MFNEIVTHYTSDQLALILLVVVQVITFCVGLVISTVRHLIRKHNQE
ncbi:MAG: hypothetical protein J5654_09505 [Victivallales bacterium]|nr:hypothetical protein [Victivallales bacterium]